ncbi:MAG: FAD-binding oxidoreductase [Alphaproteobacteria bacterium]|jgi:FAD/FMN-containing dehydrogenase
MPDGVLEILEPLVAQLDAASWSEPSERYTMDWSTKFSGSCIGVARPTTVEEVSKIVKYCFDNDIGIVPQGGHTGLCGGATPWPNSNNIVLSLERMNQVRNVDTAGMTMTVEAGVVLQNVQKTALDAGCFFPLSLGAQGSCMIGGNISTNAGGVNVLKFGNTRDQVLGLEVVLPDGEIYRGLKRLKKDNSGYDLKQYFIGAEGTLGIITAATLKIYPGFVDKGTAICAVPDMATSLSLLNKVRAATGDQVTAGELIHRSHIENVTAHIPNTRDPFDEAYEWYLILEISATSKILDIQASMEEVLGEALEEGLALDVVIAQSEAQSAQIWDLREMLPEAGRHAGKALSHDLSVALSDVAEFHEDFIKSCRAVVPDCFPMGFGHIGDGNLHVSVRPAPGKDYFDAETEAKLETAMFDCTKRFGGSFSAEHGIGQRKLPQMHAYKDAVDLKVMRAVKAALDPKGIMNPGKVVG